MIQEVDGVQQRETHGGVLQLGRSRLLQCWVLLRPWQHAWSAAAVLAKHPRTGFGRAGEAATGRQSCPASKHRLCTLNRPHPNPHLCDLSCVLRGPCSLLLQRCSVTLHSGAGLHTLALA